jgi:hypothetical protein
MIVYKNIKHFNNKKNIAISKFIIVKRNKKNEKKIDLNL